MRTLCCWLAIATTLLVGTRAAKAQDPIVQLRERAAPAIVKIIGKGTTPAGREVPFEGSGVVLGSVQDVSIIVTAAHVIGRAGTWRPTASGDPDREFKVSITRSPGGALEPLPQVPTVAAQNDSSDFAILLVRGRLPGLPIGNPLQLAQSAQTVVMGYTRGASNLDVLVGRGQLVTREALGFVLQLSQMQTSEGNSGGPVLDLDASAWNPERCIEASDRPSPCSANHRDAASACRFLTPAGTHRDTGRDDKNGWQCAGGTVRKWRR